MILIAGIVAIVCVNNGNIGGAIVAMAVGCIVHVLLEGGENE